MAVRRQAFFSVGSSHCRPSYGGVVQRRLASPGTGQREKTGFQGRAQLHLTQMPLPHDHLSREGRTRRAEVDDGKTRSTISSILDSVRRM